MKNLYWAMWWVWPLSFVLLVLGQQLYGRAFIGYWVIPVGMLIASGSALFGVMGLFLVKERPEHKRAPVILSVF